MGWQHQYHWQWAYCKLFQMWICQPATSNMKLFVTIVIGFIISKTKTLFFQYSGFLDRHGLRFHVVFFNWTWDLVKILTYHQENLDLPYRNLDLSSSKSRPFNREILDLSSTKSQPFKILFSTVHIKISTFHSISGPFIIKSWLLAEMASHKKRFIFCKK